MALAAWQAAAARSAPALAATLALHGLAFATAGAFLNATVLACPVSRPWLGPIRSCGTVGFIAGGWLVALAVRQLPGRFGLSFLLAAAASAGLATAAGLGLLPAAAEATADQEPSRLRLRGAWPLAGACGLALLAAVAVLALGQKVFDQGLNLFLTETGVANPDGESTRAQYLEVFLLCCLPLLNRFPRLGGWALLAGPLAWMGLFGALAVAAAHGRSDWALAALPLQGFNCVWTTVASMLVQRRAPRESHSLAQALLAAVGSGGTVAGTVVAGGLFAASALPGGGHDWPGIWPFPAGVAAVALVLAGADVMIAARRPPRAAGACCPGVAGTR